MPANLENSAVATGLKKVSFHSSPKERQCQRMLGLISHASIVILKIPQARLQQYMNQELPDVQTVFRKGRGTRDQLPTSTVLLKKQESSRKTSISAYSLTKPLTVWITTNCGKFLKRIQGAWFPQLCFSFPRLFWLFGIFCVSIEILKFYFFLILWKNALGSLIWIALNL